MMISLEEVWNMAQILIYVKLTKLRVLDGHLLIQQKTS